MEDFKFSTLEYKRPDFEKTGAFAEEITQKIKNAASYVDTLKENFVMDIWSRWRRCRKIFRRTARSHLSAIP